MPQEISWDPAANGGSGGWTVSESAPSSDLAADRTRPALDAEPASEQPSVDVREPLRPDHSPAHQTIIRRPAASHPGPPAPPPAAPDTGAKTEKGRFRAAALAVGSLMLVGLVIAAAFAMMNQKTNSGAGADPSSSATPTRSPPGHNRARAARRQLALTRLSYDGDGRTDLAVQPAKKRGDVKVLISERQRFKSVATWVRLPENEHRLSGDFDGDGLTDVCIFDKTAAGQSLSVLRSSGQFFARPVRWGSIPVQIARASITGDYNGDHLVDLLNQVEEPDGHLRFNVLQSTGKSFEKQKTWTSGNFPWVFGKTSLLPGDFNADGLTDILGMKQQGGSISAQVALSTGSHFAQPKSWGTIPDAQQGSLSKPVGGDFDGDGTTDLLVITPSTDGGAKAQFVRSTRSGFIHPVVWWRSPAADVTRDHFIAGDYNGDHKFDVAWMTPVDPSRDSSLKVSMLLSRSQRFDNKGRWATISDMKFGTTHPLHRIG